MDTEQPASTGHRRPGIRADIIVVGAGPAGALTSLLLARRGLDVLMLDRARFPRPKPCGDCLSAAATDLLSRLGLLERVRAAGASQLVRWDVIAPDGTTATGRFPDRPALALERRLLDALLVDAAREAGARLRQATVVDLLRNPTGRVVGVLVRDPAGAVIPLEARLVVGADGLRSVVARRLGVIRRRPRIRKVSLTAHLPGPVDMRHGEMHVLPGGCVGVAPAGPRVNVTVVLAGDRTRELRAGAAGLFMESVGRARGVLDRLGRPDPDELLASGPFDWPTRTPVADGAALVGDAAGYFDPFTGQGIHHAMAGGEALAAAVGPALARDAPADLDEALLRYARRRAAMTRPAHRVQRVVEAVVSRPALANLALGRLARSAVAMDRLIEVTGDLRPPRSLLSGAVVSSLVFPSAPETP